MLLARLESVNGVPKYVAKRPARFSRDFWEGRNWVHKGVAGFLSWLTLEACCGAAVLWCCPRRLVRAAFPGQ